MGVFVTYEGLANPGDPNATPFELALSEKDAVEVIDGLANDGFFSFSSAIISEAVGKWIKSLSLNTNLTIAQVAMQLDEAVYGALHVFNRDAAIHMQRLYDIEANQQVRGHMTRVIRGNWGQIPISPGRVRAEQWTTSSGRVRPGMPGRDSLTRACP